MPIPNQTEDGLLDGINAAAIDKRLSFIHAINKQTGDPVLLLCCTFNGRTVQVVPLAEMIVGRDLDIYQLPEEIKSLVPSQASGDIEVGIPGFDTL